MTTNIRCPSQWAAGSLVLCGLMLVACTANATIEPSGSPESALILLATRPPDVPGCALAEIEGTLVADARTGLGVLGAGGGETSVFWPVGFTARAGANGITLFDADGIVIAHQGDTVIIGGGMDTGGGEWIACPTGIEVSPGSS